MVTYRELYIKLLIVFGSLLLSFLLIEGFLRIFYPFKFYSKRYLFMTKHSLLEQKSVCRYYPNTDIREVAVYEQHNGFIIEYDHSFLTNNIGLVQKNNFSKLRNSIVFIGDSFTQGEGSNPWFYKLENCWKNNKYQLVNLGILGTGIAQWNDTLKWFSKIG